MRRSPDVPVHPEPPSGVPLNGPRRRRRQAVAVIGAGALSITAAAIGVSIATADPSAPRTGVRAPALYVASDGTDSRTPGGLNFSGDATGVNAANGNLIIHEIDDRIAAPNGSFDRSVFAVDRWYNSRLAARRDLGKGWTTGLGYDVRLDTTSSTQIALVAPSEHVITFPVDPTAGPFTASDDTSYTLRRDGTGWIATNASAGRDYVFDGGGNLQRIEDQGSGQSERFDYTSAGGQSRLSAVVGPDTKAHRFSFNGNGQIIEVDNPASQHGYYGYTGDLLTRATHPDGKVSDYTYNADQRLATVTRTGYGLTVSYDSQGRVSSFTETKNSSTSTATLSYRAPQPGTCDPARDAQQTDVTSSAGTKSYCFDQNGDLTSGAADADFAEQTIPLGNRTWAFGDLDGDGIGDLALVDKSTGAIASRLNPGNATFPTEATIGSFGGAVKDIASGDVDAYDSDDIDGLFDTSDILARDPANTLGLRLSKGDSTTSADPGSAPHQSTWPADRALQLADVNGDGSADLWSVDPSTQELRVALGNADGFDPTSTWATVPSGVTVLLGDVDDDDDGTADLVTYNPATGAVRVGRSTGTTFGTLTTWGTGPQNADVTVGDLDGSAAKDLYFRLTSGTVSAQRATDNNTFSTTSVVLGVLPTDYAFGAVDLTGDGPASVVGTKVVGANLQIRGINVAAIQGAGS